MTGVTSRKCVYGMSTLTTIVFASDLDENTLNSIETRSINQAKHDKWQLIVGKYIPMMELAKQHDDLTDENLDDFHKLSQEFMAAWVDVSPNRSVTNYIHMFGAGHMTYYLRRYGNLYRFSQQGWEALNQKLKHFYFNNTNHGGSCGNEMLRGDHVKPLMRMCQRFIMWRLGLGTSFFQYNGDSDCDSDSVNSDTINELVDKDPNEVNHVTGGLFSNMITATL